MTQKCGGAIQTDEQIHAAVVAGLALDEKKDIRRLGVEFQQARIDAINMIEPYPDLERIVQMNNVSGTNSLSQTEWLSMEAAMPAEERQTHKNLADWMRGRAQEAGVVELKEEEEDTAEDMAVMAMLEGGEGDDDAAESEDEEPAAKGAGKGAAKEKEEKEEEEKEEKKKADEKNWSSVNLIYRECKLNFRGSFNQVQFTNWLWYRVIRSKLEDTKSKMDEVDTSDNMWGIEDIEEILSEYMPPMKAKKEDKDDKKDKKDKKDDKKDKKDKDDKKDKKDSKKDEKKDEKGSKKDDKKKSKKDKVTLTSSEKMQAQNLIDNMVYGKNGKGKAIVCGWANMMDEDEIGVKTPWEFQLGHVVRQCLQLEYAAKKKKENPDPAKYYGMVQALADAIALVRRQYQLEFPEIKVSELGTKMLPLADAYAIQKRFIEGSVGTLKFNLLWYLQNCAHLISGSFFMNRHKTTVFKPFGIQIQMVDAIMRPGPQLVFGIAPPGTGKTAIVAHMLNLFPQHSLVFVCAALPVVLGVGRISNSLGIPYAFIKGRRLTPSFSCGRGLGTHADTSHELAGPQTAIESLRYLSTKLNLERKKKRLALKKRLRNLHDLKKFPRLYLMCDVGSAAWLLRQLDPNRTILVIDEPPMGSDTFPERPEENALSCAMVQTMLTAQCKNIWMSATLPRVSAMPTLVNSFLERFRLTQEEREEHVRECFSTELDRGALMCGPTGAVAFPHQKCVTADSLGKLCVRLPGDPLVLKAYTERALASLLSRWQVLDGEGKIPQGFKDAIISPDVQFADLSELNHASIRAYALQILTIVAAQGNDELCKAFCEGRDDAEANVFPAFNLTEMLFSNAYAFPGLTLISNDDPAGQMLEMSVKLMEQFPRWQDLEDDIKKQEAEAAKAEKFREKEKDEGAPDMEANAPRLKFNPDLVIQSEQFLKRWCPARPANSPTLARLLPSIAEFLAIKNLPVDERWQMLALAGAAAFDPKLDSDAGNPVYTQWVHENMTANRLACVSAGKEFTWGANVPASTVVVTKSFAETTSVAGMLQYVGRAARRGLTTHGQAVFEREEDLDRIFATPDGLSTEALTMERYAEYWLSKGERW